MSRGLDAEMNIFVQSFLVFTAAEYHKCFSPRIFCATICCARISRFSLLQSIPDVSLQDYIVQQFFVQEYLGFHCCRVLLMFLSTNSLCNSLLCKNILVFTVAEYFGCFSPRTFGQQFVVQEYVCFHCYRV